MGSWRNVFARGRGRRARAWLSRGQTAIMVLLATPVMLGALALGVDVGVMYLNWVQLQKAADGAVLAGANSLPADPTAAASTANLWVTNNAAKSSEITATSVAGDDLSITISLQRTVPYGQVLGLVNQKISVTATAGIKQNPEGASGLLPIGLSCDSGEGFGDCAYQVDTMYQLKGGQVGPGNWAPLELGGTPGANAYRSYLRIGFTGTIPSTVPTETGNLVGPTGQAISERLTKGQAMDPTATYLNHQDYDPRLVVLPLVQYNDPNGKKPVTVVGYALGWLDSVSGANSGNSINLYFLGWASQPTSSDTPNSFGINTPILMH